MVFCNVSYKQQQQEEALVPKFWGKLWILNQLVRVGHMYYFLLFCSIQTRTLSLNWHVLLTISIVLFSIQSHFLLLSIEQPLVHNQNIIIIFFHFSFSNTELEIHY